MGRRKGPRFPPPLPPDDESKGGEPGDSSASAVAAYGAGAGAGGGSSGSGGQAWPRRQFLVPKGAVVGGLSPVPAMGYSPVPYTFSPHGAAGYGYPPLW